MSCSEPGRLLLFWLLQRESFARGVCLNPGKTRSQCISSETINTLFFQTISAISKKLIRIPHSAKRVMRILRERSFLVFSFIQFLRFSNHFPVSTWFFKRIVKQVFLPWASTAEKNGKYTGGCTIIFSPGLENARVQKFNAGTIPGLKQIHSFYFPVCDALSDQSIIDEIFGWSG